MAWCADVARAALRAGRKLGWRLRSLGTIVENGGEDLSFVSILTAGGTMGLQWCLAAMSIDELTDGDTRMAATSHDSNRRSSARTGNILPATYHPSLHTPSPLSKIPSTHSPPRFQWRIGASNPPSANPRSLPMSVILRAFTRRPPGRFGPGSPQIARAR